MNRAFLAMVSFITLGMAAPAPAQNRDAALAALMKLPAVERHARLVVVREDLGRQRWR